MKKYLRMMEANLKNLNKQYNELVQVPTLAMSMAEFLQHLQNRKVLSGQIWELEAEIRREAIYELEAD